MEGARPHAPRSRFAVCLRAVILAVVQGLAAPSSWSSSSTSLAETLQLSLLRRTEDAEMEGALPHAGAGLGATAGAGLLRDLLLKGFELDVAHGSSEMLPHPLVLERASSSSRGEGVGVELPPTTGSEGVFAGRKCGGISLVIPGPADSDNGGAPALR